MQMHLKMMKQSGMVAPIAAIVMMLRRQFDSNTSAAYLPRHGPAVCTFSLPAGGVLIVVATDTF